jgi:Tfp pilus assembly protein PilF
MLGILTALTALQLQHWRNSERLYRHALTVNPASSRLRNNLGQWYIDQRQFDDALREVRTSITLDPFNLHARQNLGVALINTAQPRRAWACLDMLVRERPGVAGLHNLLGIAALASGHSDRAENEFRIAVGLQPSHRDATLNLANLLIDRGQARDALALLDRVLEHPARDVDLLLASGRAHGMLEQWGDAARCDAAAAALAPQGPLPRYNLANTLLRLGRVEDAVHEYRTALRLDPAWPECRANLAAALETLGRFDEACAEYAEVRRLRPAMAPMAFFREALARQRQGHPRTATELLRKALEADPEFEPARTALAAPHPK